MQVIRLVSAALAGAALFLISATAQAGNPRIALVIGESAYPDAALPTAANDAGLVAQVLQAAGFDVVGARDLDQKGVRESLRDFLEKANAAGPDMQAFVYFSGRALQYSGDNYLAPIDAHIARDSDVPIEAIRLSDFTRALAAAPGLARIVVIDGARANSYGNAGQPLAGGLALVNPAPGSILAFNAAPGAIGVEDAGDYGVYAKSLAGLMRQGGVDVSDILEQTRIEVNQNTQGAQIPWSAGKLGAPYFLFERAADAAPIKRRFATKKPLKQLSAEDAYQVVIARDRLSDYEAFLRDHARSQQARRIEAILAARREAMFWRRALDANSPRAYWTYLRRYPRGPHAYDAGRRLETLDARREPPPDFEVLDYAGLPPPPQREIVYADRPVYYFGGDDYGPPPPPPPRDFYIDERDQDWDDLPPPPTPTLAGVLPTLAIAIPLMIAARAYHDRPRRDGRAPPSAEPPPRRAFAPPPLPHGVTVQATPTARPPRGENGASQMKPGQDQVKPSQGKPGQGKPGQVKFAPPPTAAPPQPNGKPPQADGKPPRADGKPPRDDGKPREPGVKPTPEANRTPLPIPGATPTHGAKPTPEANRTPLPTPGAKPTHGGKPTPEANRTPLPTSGATPPPGGKPTPEANRTPSPTPGVTPTPSGKPTPEASRTPLPTPGATPGHGRKPRPDTARTPAPDASSAPAVEARPAHTPKAKREPQTSKPLDAQPKPDLKPNPAETRRLAPRIEPVKPARAQREEPLKSAPRVEPMKPAPRAESPKPAPRVEPQKPAPRAEPPRPAPRAEPPRPAPAPRVEPVKPVPAKPAACGHPGQPHC